MKRPATSCPGVPRRSFLTDTGMGFTGLALGAMLSRDGFAATPAAATLPSGLPHFRPRAKSVIWIFLSGGYSHVETFDPKPALNRYAGLSFDKTPLANPLKSDKHHKRFRSVPAQEVNVRDVYLNAGAGFMVVLSGEIMTMPGLPKVPASDNIDIDADGIRRDEPVVLAFDTIADRAPTATIAEPVQDESIVTVPPDTTLTLTKSPVLTFFSVRPPDQARNFTLVAPMAEPRSRIAATLVFLSQSFATAVLV